jgi:YjbE family integral membrane protein
MEIFTAEFWIRWLAIVVIDLTLAGDNALVIALAVRTLPPREQFWGRIGGSLGAVGLRLAFIAIITQLLAIPLLQAIGGVLLVWIATKLVRQDASDGEGHKVRQGTSLWEAVWIIILADVIMSLDNVVAVAGAAHGDMLLVVFGVGLSIPLVVWGSGVLARLMARFAWIVWVGAGVLGYVAGEMILKDAVVHQWIEPWVNVLHRLLPIVLFASMTALGWLLARRTRNGEELAARALDGEPEGRVR